MKLYVGNLPHKYNDQDLAQLFSGFGQVSSARIIMDRELGRSKGFGFVELDSDEEAKKAIHELNGKDAGGRTIVVSEARPLEPRGEGGFGQNRGRGPRPSGERQGRRPY